MRATPWPQGCTVAPLLWQSPLAESFSTIHAVPISALADETELALVLLMDRPHRKILFQVPNTKLNWRFHFGCRLEKGQASPTEEVASVLQGHDISVQALRKAGTMLFSFPKPQDPLRVQVLEAEVDSTCCQKTGGTWTKFDEIPYSEMWADDVLWLPWFVQDDKQLQFEGHFLFDGPPGPTSQLVAHNCQRLDNIDGTTTPS